MEELQLFSDHHQSALLHWSSRRHINEAYSREYDALQVLGRLHSEEVEAARTHDEVVALEEKAHNDENEAGKLEYAGEADRLDYVASRLKGTSVEKRAEKEAEEANELFAHADQLEEEGIKRLHQAEAVLNGTSVDPTILVELAAPQRGICRWLAWACSEKSTSSDWNKKISNETVSLASEFSESLKLIDQAEKERGHAMKLLQKSYSDVNQSIAILEQANNYREEAEEAYSKAARLHDEAKDEESQAKIEERIDAFEDAEVEEDKARFIGDLNAMSRLVIQAKEEARNATDLDFRKKKEQETIHETNLEIRKITYDAKMHVTHAGWIALCTVILSSSLFVVTVIRVANTLRENEPMSWLMRNPELEIRDVSYIYLHVLLLLLTLAFSGQLLLGYYKVGLVGRLKVLGLFAMVGAFFQVSLLHFLPNLIRLIVLSSLNCNTFLTLLHENVMKSGVVVFGVYILELLLIWVNCGSLVFSRAYRWNGIWLWLVVGIVSLVHVIFLEKYTSSDCQRGFSVKDLNHEDSFAMSVIENEQGTEMHSLGSCSSPSDISPSLESVDLKSRDSHRSTYGSTSSTKTGRELSHEINATFVSPWPSQVTRLKVLVDILLASWALWVARHNLWLIFRLSPISAGIVWGFFPLWVLGASLVAIIALSFYCLCEWKRRKRLQRSSSVEEAGDEVTTTPLLVG